MNTANRTMNKYLRRALKENPHLNVAQWKRGWYQVGRRLKK